MAYPAERKEFDPHFLGKAPKKEQTYYFIFVHEDGEGLRKVSEMFIKKQIHASVDGVFTLDDVNKALQKVASSGSKGKTIIQVSK